MPIGLVGSTEDGLAVRSSGMVNFAIAHVEDRAFAFCPTAFAHGIGMGLPARRRQDVLHGGTSYLRYDFHVM